MDTKWEIRKISTPERIFDKIVNEMTQPVGIVLFGADCDLKVEVLSMIVEQQLLFVMLDVDESRVPELRRKVVQIMRNNGVKTVVGIYARVKKERLRALKRGAERVEAFKCIDAIEQGNPYADDLDYFIVVEEEEG